MSTQTPVKPSDFPREERFRDPRTPPFRDERGLRFDQAEAERITAGRTRNHRPSSMEVENA